MRVIVLTIAGLVGLAVISVQAAPLPPPKAEVGGNPAIELVAQGCGPGGHRHHWRDYWGRWHWGRCVPNW